MRIRQARAHRGHQVAVRALPERMDHEAHPHSLTEKDPLRFHLQGIEMGIKSPQEKAKAQLGPEQHLPLDAPH